MENFRKKPVVIQAEAWMGTTEQYNKFTKMGAISPALHEDGSCTVSTVFGIRKCNLNDWIVKGVEGDFYSISDVEFKKTYEKV